MASQSDFSASPQTEKEPLSLSLSKRLGQLQGLSLSTRSDRSRRPGKSSK
jgi:hypothetical protein